MFATADSPQKCSLQCHLNHDVFGDANIETIDAVKLPNRDDVTSEPSKSAGKSQRRGRTLGTLDVTHRVSRLGGGRLSLTCAGCRVLRVHALIAHQGGDVPESPAAGTLPGCVVMLTNRMIEEVLTLCFKSRLIHTKLSAVSCTILHLR